MSRVGAVIAAAGMSRRMQGADKLDALVRGKPVLGYTIEQFQACPAVSEIVLVVRATIVEQWRYRSKNQGWSKVSAVVEGGATRQHSVRAGLEALTPCDWVMVHDGARPCVTQDILIRGLEAVKDTGAAIAAVPAKDTVKFVGADWLIEATPERERVWLAQTPQVFAYDIIRQAHIGLNGEATGLNRQATDDASLVEAMGRRVKVFLGAYTNIKVTTPEDLALAEAFLRGGMGKGTSV